MRILTSNLWLRMYNVDSPSSSLPAACVATRPFNVERNVLFSTLFRFLFGFNSFDLGHRHFDMAMCDDFTTAVRIVFYRPNKIELTLLSLWVCVCIFFCYRHTSNKVSDSKTENIEKKNEKMPFAGQIGSCENLLIAAYRCEKRVKIEKVRRGKMLHHKNLSINSIDCRLEIGFLVKMGQIVEEGKKNDKRKMSKRRRNRIRRRQRWNRKEKSSSLNLVLFN